MSMSGLKQVAYYGVAMLVLKGLGFLMLPIATRLLTQQEYGSLNFLVTISAVCSLLLSLGLPELLFRQHYQDDNQKVAFFRDCLVVSIGVCFVFLIVVLVFTQSITNLLPGDVDLTNLRLLAVNLFASSVLAIPYSYYRLVGNAKHYCYLAVVHGVFQTGLSIGLLFMGFGVTGVMLSGAISASLVLIAGLWLLIPLIKMTLTQFKWQIESRHLLFLTSILISSLCLYGSNGAENWFIVALEGERTLAVYFVAAQFALMTSFTFEPIRMWWFAKRFDVLANEPNEYGYMALRSLNLGLILCAIMMVVVPVIFKVTLPASYYGNDMWLTGLILVVVLRHHSDIFNIACYKYRNGVWVTYINAISAVLVVSMFSWLIPIYKVDGVVSSLLLVQVVRCLAFILVSQRLEYVDYRFQSLFIVWLSLGALTCLSYIQPTFIYAYQAVIIVVLLAIVAKQYSAEVTQCIKYLPKRGAYV